MAILLVAEHDNATLSDQTAKALTAASQIGGDVDVLVAGKGAKAAADAAAKLKGVPLSSQPFKHCSITTLRSQFSNYCNFHF